LTQKFKVGALPPAQVLGNNGFFYFQYLLKPKSSSTVSSSVRNQTTTGRDHESSPRAKRQPFSNKVRLLMRLNSNWPAERERALSSSTAFTSTLFCFQNWNITEEETKKKTKTQYIIDSPLIICAYSIYESGCITASIVYVAQELLPQVTKSGGDDVTKGRRRELRVKEPRIPWRVF
jgi:hypothetical protein